MDLRRLWILCTIVLVCPGVTPSSEKDFCKGGRGLDTYCSSAICKLHHHLKALADSKIKPQVLADMAALGATGCEHVSTTPSIRIVVGIMSQAEDHHRRTLIRQSYKRYPNVYSRVKNSNGTVDVRFVLGLPSTADHISALVKEYGEHEDIIVLDVPENGDGGKSFRWFLYASSRWRHSGVQYVLKGDQDTYLRTIPLEKRLMQAPRTLFYSGIMMTRSHTGVDGGAEVTFQYAGGMAYVLSIDLVHWIAHSELAARNSAGPEDLLTGFWFAASGISVTIDNYDAGYHDWKPESSGNTRPVTNSSIAIHRSYSQEDFDYFVARFPDKA